MWRAVHAYEGVKDNRKVGDSGETLVNKLPMVEQSGKQDLQVDSSVVVVTRASRLRLEERIKRRSMTYQGEREQDTSELVGWLVG